MAGRSTRCIAANCRCCCWVPYVRGWRPSEIRRGAHQVSRAVHVVDELPLIAAGKIDKKLLRAPHKTAN
jgi:acyl-CoA synthetase (AMP-forming)/AMP-acid ligase II